MGDNCLAINCSFTGREGVNARDGLALTGLELLDSLLASCVEREFG